jgi:hypothetical protein
MMQSPWLMSLNPHGSPLLIQPGNRLRRGSVPQMRRQPLSFQLVEPQHPHAQVNVSITLTGTRHESEAQEAKIQQPTYLAASHKLWTPLAHLELSPSVENRPLGPKRCPPFEKQDNPK